MTNGDKIREMFTDEYLAQHLCGIYVCCADCPLYWVDKCCEYDLRLNYLKQGDETND